MRFMSIPACKYYGKDSLNLWNHLRVLHIYVVHTLRNIDMNKVGCEYSAPQWTEDNAENTENKAFDTQT